MATQTGWLCYNCFLRFNIDDHPNWAEERLKLLNDLHQTYSKLLTTRKRSEHKAINEMLSSINEEICQVHNDDDEPDSDWSMGDLYPASQLNINRE